jgi:hypothetical protein
MLLSNINAIHRVALVPVTPARRRILRELLKPYQTVAFPHYIVTRRTAPFPLTPTANRYQVYAWEVMSMGNRLIFRPENSAAYRQESSTTDNTATV